MSQYDLIIKNGTIVNSFGSVKADLAVQGEKIAAIGNLENACADKVIDAKGMLVMPGMIDSHAHIESGTGESKSRDTYYTGSIAAAYGGTTSFVDFAFNNPGEKPKDSMKRKMEEAEGNSVLDYSFHPCINQMDEESLESIRYFLQNGFPSIKLFTVYRNSLMLEKPGVYQVLKMVSEENGIALIHAESPELIEHNIAEAVRKGTLSAKDHANSRPVISELEAMYGVLGMVRDTGAKAIFAHMTTGASRTLLESASDVNLYAEVCPHYLILDEKVYDQENGYNYICSPPIRGAKDRDALWQLIEDGYVQMINSDHTDYHSEQKEKYKDNFTKVPNGLPTIETRGMAFFSEAVAKGRISAEKFVSLTSTNAAKLMGVYTQKGVLAPGSDADIVIVDPKKTYTMRAADMHMQTDFCPYEGMEMTGRVNSTIARGTVLIENETFVETGHRGRLMKRGVPVTDGV